MKNHNKIGTSQNQTDPDETFNQVYREHFGRLYFFATKLTKSEEMAKDVVSDVFVKLWTSQTDFSKIRDIEAYLFISVKNQSIQTLSQSARNLMNPEVENSIKEIDKTNPEDVLIEKELLLALEEAVKSLPDQCQLVFRLAREKHMSYQEIAVELSIAPCTVKSHMIKAISDIRIFVSERYDDSKSSKFLGGFAFIFLSFIELGQFI